MKLPFKTVTQYIRDFYYYAGNSIIILFFLNLVMGAVELLGIGLLLPVLNLGFESEGTDNFSKIFQEIFDFFNYDPTLGGLLILLVLVFLTKALAVFLIKYTSSAIAVNLKGALQNDLADRISNASYSYYTSLKSGWLNNILMKESALFTQGFLEFVRIQTTLVYIVVYLATASILRIDLMLIICVLGFVMLLPMRYLMLSVRSVSKNLTYRSGTLSASFSEFLENFIYSKATGANSRLRQEIKNKILQMNIAEKRLLLFSAFTSAITEPVAIIALAVLVYTQVVLGGSVLSEVMILGLLIHRIVGQLMLLQGQWQRFNSTFGSIEIIKDTLTAFKENTEGDGTERIGSINELSFHDVSFSYGSQSVLENINISISKNSMIGLVGPSGSGKTTLFYMITGLLSPTSGTMTVNEIDSKKLVKSSLRQHIGYVSQTPAMLDGSILDNVVFGEFEKDDKDTVLKVQNVLKQAGLEEFIDELDKQVGERGMKLSGGQRQRIALARELLKETDLLILDEATSALDEKSDVKIQATLEKLKGTKTIIIISHKLGNVEKCDRIYRLEDGKVISK